MRKITITKRMKYILVIILIISLIAIVTGYIHVKHGKIETETELQGTIGFLIIVGVSLGLIKFAMKAALGCGFAALRKREILAVALVYFSIGFAMGALIEVMGSALGELIVSVLIFTSVILGALQAVLALCMLGFGVYTIKKWTHKKKDITRKTSLLMVLPCPISILTIFMACSVLVITGMEGIIVGLLIGGIFFVFIVGISFAIKKSKLKKTPSSFGVVMIFFALLYVFSVLLIPAYLPVSKMNIAVENFSIAEIIPGALFMITMVSIGFILGGFNTKNKLGVG